jgi:hypothetical protein
VLARLVAYQREKRIQEGTNPKVKQDRD